jgi:hypothetical protein
MTLAIAWNSLGFHLLKAFAPGKTFDAGRICEDFDIVPFLAL